MKKSNLISLCLLFTFFLSPIISYCQKDGVRQFNIKSLNNDVDSDGLANLDEINIYHTNPYDDDTDDDGLLDGNEVNIYMTDPLCRDTDKDNLQDGTEIGISVPQGSDTWDIFFIPDADGGLTTTSPLLNDSDSGGLIDGYEDMNRNGRIDAGETDPNNTSDDYIMDDSDNDFLPNAVELSLGTDSIDDDTDNDGILDGNEILVTATDPRYYDTDQDGLSDGVECGLSAPQGTGTDMYEFRKDFDAGLTTTVPYLYDTDGGGINDGQEDANQNGRFDPTEFDPNNREDDPIDDVDGDGLIATDESYFGTDPTRKDTDGDGLSDAYEIIGPDGIFGSGDEPGTNPVQNDTDSDNFADGEEIFIYFTDPLNFDTDNDSLGDQNEVFIFMTNPLDDDSDDDGLLDGHEIIFYNTNPASKDSDGDMLQDGTEIGISAAEGVNTNLTVFIPDADLGATITNPNVADSDTGGVIDGFEDTNLNGIVDFTETDPLLGADDVTPVDTDGDSLPDDLETNIGTDPLDIDSDNDGISDDDEIFVYGSNPISTDSDGDGLSDGNEVLVHGTNPIKNDTDNDGLLDYTEINITMTDPLNGDSDGDSLLDGDEVNVYFSDPHVMDTDSDNLTDDYEIYVTFTNPIMADSDLDSLNDGQEHMQYSTDPMNRDTDNDWMIDGDEVLVYSCDPFNTDTDTDMLPDGGEIIYNCDPLIADMDSDNLTDGFEIFVTYTDPLNPDTDNDSLWDGTEYSYGTDPLDDDTDDDYLIDGQEVLYVFTDPTNPDTDNDTSIDGLDCAPLNNEIYPGAPEIECDGIDSDCNPSNEDTTPPLLEHPNHIYLYVNNNCEAVVPDVSPWLIMNDGCSDTVIFEQYPLPGEILIISDQVAILCSDTSGNVSSGNILIYLKDSIAPEIICPTDIESSSAQIYYDDILAMDNCSGLQLSFIQGLGSGAIFPEGDTHVEFQTADSAGNITGCTFTVTYNPVGISENNIGSISFELFPNPAHKFINVRNNTSESDIKVILINSLGQIAHEMSSIRREFAIPLDELGAGLYYVSILTQSEMQQYKIVIY